MGSRIRKAAAAAGFAALAMLPVTAAQAENWTCYTYNPQDIVAQGLAKIGEQIEAITAGRIDVTCHAAGSLGISAADITAAVSDGVVQLASNAFITGAVPITGIFSLPGLFATEEELQKGLEIVKPYIDEAMEAQDLVYLGAYNYPRQVIFSTEQVTSLEDLKGKKIRVAGVEQAEFAKRFGGAPVTIGTPDVAPALQLGTISVVLSAASGGARLWTDFLKYNLEIGPNFTVSPVIMNRDAWDELSEEEQQKVLAAVQEITAAMTTEFRDTNAELVKQNAAKGMVVTAGSPADEERILATLKDYWPIWAKERGDAATEALAKVEAALGK